MGGTTVNVPGPSKEELRLRTEQADLLQFQRETLQRDLARQELLDPILFEEIGITPILNEEGETIGFERDPDPAGDLRDENELAILERQKLALAGDLPISPTLERELGEGRENLEQRLRRQLGTGFDVSSPGIEALGDFDRNATELREGARRGEINLTTQLGIAQGGFNLGAQGQTLSQTFGVSQSGLPFTGAMGPVSSGFGQAAGAFQQDRSLQLQASIANANNRAGVLGDLFSGIGTGFGLLLGASDKRLKTNIEEVGTTAHGLPLYEFNYTDYGGRFRGVMAQDVLEIMPEAVITRHDGYYMVNYSMLGIRMEQVDG